MITKKELIEEVKRLDPTMSEKDEAFFIASVLLSGLAVGADYKQISKFLGVRSGKVFKYKKNLEEAEIWTKDGRTSCNWFNKKTGSIAFWMDVLVAQGMLERTDKNAKKLGKKGGEATLKEHGKEKMKEWGRKGGRPKSL